MYGVFGAMLDAKAKKYGFKAPSNGAIQEEFNI